MCAYIYISFHSKQSYRICRLPQAIEASAPRSAPLGRDETIRRRITQVSGHYCHTLLHRKHFAAFGGRRRAVEDAYQSTSIPRECLLREITASYITTFATVVIAPRCANIIIDDDDKYRRHRMHARAAASGYCRLFSPLWRLMISMAALPGDDCSSNIARHAHRRVDEEFSLPSYSRDSYGAVIS